jgi:hypothetical protein
MYHLLKFVKRDPAWALAWGIRSDQLGMFLFKAQEFIEKTVIFSVRDKRVIENVIAMGVFLKKEA